MSQTSSSHLSGNKEEFPQWVQEGLREFEQWLKEVYEKPGGNTGSPHVRVGLPTMMALINSEDMKEEKHRVSHRTLKEWWNQVVKANEATENDIASEIRVFKLRGPLRAKMTDQDGDDELIEVNRKPHVKLEVVMENKQIQMTLRQVLKDMGAEIKNGPPPCSKPTRKVKALLKALQQA